MAEKFLQNKLYEYRANSNLVLESDRDARNRREEGKGEVESLKSKVHALKMGDRIRNSSLSNDGPSKRRKVEASETQTGKHKQVDLLEKFTYVPKSIECRQAYEEFLTVLRHSIGDLSQEMLRGAATEILEILKDSNLPAPSQKVEIQRLTADLNEDKFRQLLSISKRITDYDKNINTTSHDISGVEEGMAVVFDDDNDIGEDDVVDEEDELDIMNDANHTKQLKSTTHEDLAKEADNLDNLSVHDIDAYWLQRQLSKYYNDSNISAKLADEVLATLNVQDERLCENNLVLLLDFDKFDLIKLLLKNRRKIYYCIKLKQAQSDADRQAIEIDMKGDFKFGGNDIWNQLNETNLAGSWSKDRIGVIADKVRREAIEIAKLSDMSMDGIGLDEITSGKIDLEALAFKDGGHFMANTKCELPEKSWRAQKKGYEEVHIPALKPIQNSDEKLVSIFSLPDWMHGVFEGVRNLNRIQSKMCTAALEKDHNMLLCAPTGSGKTNVALLSMLGVVKKYRDMHGFLNLQDFKIVYIAPMKALVQECVQNFGKRLSCLNMTVRELSGDQSLNSREISDTNVIVTTPEKWDVVTRKSMDRLFAQMVKLIIIDEIHLLHDDRGAVLEGIVARTLRQSEIDGNVVRLVGLSATLPNYEDVATFLRVDPSGLFYFDSSFRPVPLQQQFIGITEKKVLKKIQVMNEICYEKALLHAGKNQILIFTHSRADTVKTAKALLDFATTNDTLSKFVKDDSASSEILKTESANAKSHELRDLLPFGFAVHHAGLQRVDRSLVEDLFADRHIQVLVSTATLAWGVNLPCHTVIIKGTQIYSPEKGAWTELSPLDILQMIGRAGRYGLDSEGEGIIITNHSELQYYLSLVNNQLPIESQLVKKLPDLLNAEIVSGSITSLNDAAEWLGYSYMYIRMLKNPELYGIDPNEFSNDKTLLNWRTRLASAGLSTLEKNDLLKFDRKSGTILPTNLGRICSYFYITNETMATFKSNMRPTMSDIDILRLFGLSSEFKYIYVKEEEKLELAKLLNRVPIPIKENFDEPVAKVNVLLQAYISRMRLEGYAITSDMIFIQQSAGRLMRAMFEISVAKQWACVAERILSLCSMIERRMWCSQNALRQFHSVPEQIVRKLERIADISWEKYLDLKPQDLGEIVKNPKMGKTLFKFVHMVPKLSIAVNAIPVSRAWLRLEIQLCGDFEFNSDVHGSTVSFWLFVEDSEGDLILHYEPVLFRGGDINLTCFVKMMEPLSPQYFVKVVADRWLHSQSEVPISFKHLILPEKFQNCTELLDLKSIPVSILSDPHRMMFGHVDTLNPIQTQLYSQLNDTNDGLLVMAPPRAGKTLCGELALVKFLKSCAVEERCLVLSPHKEKCLFLFNKWHQLLKHIFGVDVCLLTGDSAVDLSLCKQSKVVIGQPSHWDALSRKWRSRKVIQQIGLYLLCDLHSIGSKTGSCYEIVISRSRFIESQLGKSVRFVAMGYTVANAFDLADWLGISKSSTFNFSRQATDGMAAIKFVPCENHDPINRVHGISKHIFRSIIDSGSSIVYLPSRKLAQVMAIDFLCFAKKSRFQPTSRHDCSWSGCNFSDATYELLSKGIGVLHGGMTDVEIQALQNNLLAGGLWVVLIPFEFAKIGKFRAEFVVVADTVVFDGVKDSFVDVAPDQLIDMGNSARKTCTVYCHVSKREGVERVFFEPIALESRLNSAFHGHLIGEIVNRTVESKSEAVDYLTWTFYYRRLSKNPNYYNLTGSSIRHISDHLSEFVEMVVADLEQSKFISVENDMDLSPLNLAMISSHYNIDYRTVELFASTLTHKSKVKGIVDVLTHAQEFSDIPIRLAEDQLVMQLLASFDLSPESSIQYRKVLALFYAHFARTPLNAELLCDLRSILNIVVNFVHSMVDVLSSQGWLKPTLAAMEVSQMIVQGMWDKDDLLLQLPHSSTETIEKFHRLDPPIETVFDLLEMDDENRIRVLNLPMDKLSDIARFCNAYPAIEVAYKASFDSQVHKGSNHSIIVDIDRDITGVEDMSSIGRVVSHRFPFEKFENWWVILGDPTTNMLYSIKRCTVLDHAKVKLDFEAPSKPGNHVLHLYIMCDSYLGVDQEYQIEVVVANQDIDVK